MVKLRAFDVAAAHRLYADLLAPVAPGLQGATHLIVVPAGPLLSLPLGLLVTQAGQAPSGPPEKADYRQVAFLGRQVPISVLPSTGSLKSLRAVAGRSKAPQPFIGFGDPAFGGAPGDTRSLVALGNLCRDGNAVDVELVRGLPRLRDTAGELRQIAQTLKAPEARCDPGRTGHREACARHGPEPVSASSRSRRTGSCRASSSARASRRSR